MKEPTKKQGRGRPRKSSSTSSSSASSTNFSPTKSVPDTDLRKRSIDMIAKALITDNEDSELLKKRAKEIETNIQKLSQDVAEYKSKVRSHAFNLRHNELLRQNIADGSLSAATFARLEHKEMANPQLKELIEKTEKDLIREAISPLYGFEEGGGEDIPTLMSTYEIGHLGQKKTGVLIYSGGDEDGKSSPFHH